MSGRSEGVPDKSTAGHADPVGFVDALVGLRVPRDYEPAYAIKSEHNGRYYYRMTERAGVITVARHHAQRFETRSAALAVLERCLDRGATRLRLVRLRAKDVG